MLVKDINPGGASFDPASTSTNVNGTLFFTADDGTHGLELWKSDGTAAGTVLVKDINPGGDSNPCCFADVNGTLYFTAGAGIWTSDGTDTGTVFVTETESGFLNVGGTLFFAFDDGIPGSELWALTLGP